MTSSVYEMKSTGPSTEPCGTVTGFGLDITPLAQKVWKPTSWHPISYRFEVIADYCLNFGRITATLLFDPRRDLEATQAVHLRLIGKPLVNFLFVFIELFFARRYGWGATREYRLEIGAWIGTLFHLTFVTLLIRVHSENDSRMYFLIVRTNNNNNNNARLLQLQS